MEGIWVTNESMDESRTSHVTRMECACEHARTRTCAHAVRECASA